MRRLQEVNDDFRVKAIRGLRKMFFEDNPNLTEFEKMAREFYYDVQELWLSWVGISGKAVASPLRTPQCIIYFPGVQMNLFDP